MTVGMKGGGSEEESLRDVGGKDVVLNMRHQYISCESNVEMILTHHVYTAIKYTADVIENDN